MLAVVGTVSSVCVIAYATLLSAHDDAEPRVGLGLFYLVYVFALHIARIATLRDMTYAHEFLWGCNTSLFIAGIGFARGKPLCVCVSVCVVALDQTLWYVDVIGYVCTRTFPIGVAKYVVSDKTSLAHFCTSWHHLWFLPLSLYNLDGPMHPHAWVGSIITTAALATCARLTTPFKAADGKVMNINLCYEFFADVNIKVLHVLDFKHPTVYLPFLITVCNALNAAPCALIYAIAYIMHSKKQ